MPTPNLICVYTTYEFDRYEIELLHVALEAKGIQVHRQGGEYYPIEWPHLGADGPLGRLLVPENQAEEARQAIEEWRASRDPRRAE